MKTENVLSVVYTGREIVTEPANPLFILSFQPTAFREQFPVGWNKQTTR